MRGNNMNDEEYLENAYNLYTAFTPNADQAMHIRMLTAIFSGDIGMLATGTHENIPKTIITYCRQTLDDDVIVHVTLMTKCDVAPAYIKHESVSIKNILMNAESDAESSELIAMKLHQTVGRLAEETNRIRR